MIKDRTQFLIVLVLLFIIMLPNIIFVWYGEDSAVVTTLKQIVFFTYTLSLILLPIIFIRPKYFFVALVFFMPFALLDLYVLSITGTQSTTMHYYSFFATNLNEAKELASSNIKNILYAIIYFGVYIYLVLKLKVHYEFNKVIRLFIGALSSLVIIALLVRDFKMAYTLSKSDLLETTAYHFFVKFDKTFPFGVTSKLESVYEEVEKISSFEKNTNDFLYKSTIYKNKPITIVLVIGETARRNNFQLYGYKRKNNPQLIKETNLIPFTNVTTCANYTLTSVAQIVSSVDPNNYQGAYKESGIMSAFKEAGFKTFWITNQSYSAGSIFNLYSHNADVFENVSKTLDMPNNDLVTIPFLSKFLEDKNKKKFIVIHSIGSHYRYNLRYPKEFAKYKPELSNNISVSDNGVELRDNYINSYDNSIFFTDFYLAEVIDKLKEDNEPSFMMYLSDHGENMYDDEKGLFLHGTPVPSKYELEIPMLMWYSDNFDKEKVNKLKGVKDEKLSSEIVFHTLTDLGGFKTKFHNNKVDLFSDSLVVGKRTFLKADGSVMNID